MKNVDDIIKELTLEEKASLCSGLDFWHLNAVERLGVPSVMVTDGPHGLRKQASAADHAGLNDSVPATCFPTASALSASWNKELLGKVGAAIGEAAQAEDIAVVLGPGVNIKRSPLGGRNFEYFSEDPYLSSNLACSYIKGVQNQGVGTSIKHFAVNNQEHRRMSIDAQVGERTLREIYLASFETAIKEAKPWTVMCSYNQVNGEFASRNHHLLTDILKNEWGYEGFVVSDWGAVVNLVDSIKAGLSLEMPGTNGASSAEVVKAVQNGSLDEKTLNEAVKRILQIVLKAKENKKDISYSKEEQHKLAKQASIESTVLLKNEDNILPLKKQGKIAVIGEFAKTPRYQGSGSSRVNATKIDVPYDEICKACEAKASVAFASGYNLTDDNINENIIAEAKDLAKQSDITILFAGLPDVYESEGYDRNHMHIPENQIKLINELASVTENITVILMNGAPIEMPWINKTKGILEAYLGGQAVGSAIADILFGEVSPSGKLAETFPIKLEDNPSYLNFPGEGDVVEYKEGLFVGYRYYDKKKLKPLFPFGFGLSYTNFDYKSIKVDKNELLDNELLNVTVSIKNTGSITAKEVVQLYVRDVCSSVIRPEKELKAFEKIELKPNEEKEITFALDKRAFAYYNVDINDWYVEDGDFEILVGKSSEDILLKEKVIVKSTTTLKKTYTLNSLLGDILNDQRGKDVLADKAFADALGMFGKIDELDATMLSFIYGFPLRTIIGFSQGKMTEEMLENLLNKLNN